MGAAERRRERERAACVWWGLGWQLSLLGMGVRGKATSILRDRLNGDGGNPYHWTGRERGGLSRCVCVCLAHAHGCLAVLAEAPPGPPACSLCPYGQYSSELCTNSPLQRYMTERDTESRRRETEGYREKTETRGKGWEMDREIIDMRVEDFVRRTAKSSLLLSRQHSSVLKNVKAEQAVT